jgi:hypothetical protein
MMLHCGKVCQFHFEMVGISGANEGKRVGFGWCNRARLGAREKMF